MTERFNIKYLVDDYQFRKWARLQPRKRWGRGVPSKIIAAQLKYRRPLGANWQPAGSKETRGFPGS